MVEELTVKSPLVFNYLCSGCTYRKSYYLPLLKQSLIKYDCLELVVIDLTGFISVAIWDGHTYTLVVVETSCYYFVGRLLKSKKEARLAVRDIIAMLERQLEVEAQQFGSNNGSKFINLIIDLFYRWNEIFHETTNPYLLEQNEITEYAIAIFFEIAQYMLHAAGVELYCWNETFIYMVYI